jgi:hypothetical protein
MADKDDEVRIGVYGPGEHSLVIYDIYLEEKGGAIKVDLGYPASFSRHRGTWVAGDNPGGMATSLYMSQLLQDFSSQESQVMTLMSLSAPPSNVACRSLAESGP